MYQCQKCNFSTHYKWNFKRHQLVHANVSGSERVMPQTPPQTMAPQSMRIHNAGVPSQAINLSNNINSTPVPQQIINISPPQNIPI